MAINSASDGSKMFVVPKPAVGVNGGHGAVSFSQLVVRHVGEVVKLGNLTRLRPAGLQAALTNAFGHQTLEFVYAFEMVQQVI